MRAQRHIRILFEMLAGVIVVLISLFYRDAGNSKELNKSKPTAKLVEKSSNQFSGNQPVSIEPLPDFADLSIDELKLLIDRLTDKYRDLRARHGKMYRDFLATRPDLTAAVATMNSFRHQHDSLSNTAGGKEYRAWTQAANSLTTDDVGKRLKLATEFSQMIAATEIANRLIADPPTREATKQWMKNELRAQTSEFYAVNDRSGWTSANSVTAPSFEILSQLSTTNDPLSVVSAKDFSAEIPSEIQEYLKERVKTGMSAAVAGVPLVGQSPPEIERELETAYAVLRQVHVLQDELAKKLIEERAARDRQQNLQ